MSNRDLKALLTDILCELCDLFKHQKNITKKIEEYFSEHWGVERNVRL